MKADPPPYAELHCRSNFTFLRGASLPEEMVARAAEKRYSSLALTDEASLSGVVRAHIEARERGIHFIVGSELQLTTAGGLPFARVVLLAQDRRGYGNLSELITLARRRAAKGSYAAHVADIEGKTAKAPHLAGMAGCLVLLLPEKDATEEQIFSQCMWLKTWFGDRAWVAASRWLEMDDELRLVRARGGGSACRPAYCGHSQPAHALHQQKAAAGRSDRRAGRPPGAGMRLRPAFECAAVSCAAARCWRRNFHTNGSPKPSRSHGNAPSAWKSLRYEYPDEIVPAGATPASHLRELTYRGAI
jgi:error-prone DNA polymerase